MKNKLNFLMSLFFLSIVSTSFSQEYGQGTPGADNYTGECRVDYVNAFRDGKACAEGNKSFCGIDQPTSSPQCKQAQIEGYATGYEYGKITRSPQGPEKPCGAIDRIFRKCKKTKYSL